MKREVLSKYKIVGVFILGVIFGSIGVYATARLSSSEISYDNKLSGIKATTMKGAIDELYGKANSCKEGSESTSSGNFVSAVSYNESSCITGEESTCKITTCYKNKTANSCKAGDIIDYQVNNEETIRFHVMYDKGDTLIMQSQEEIGESIWASKEDFIASGGILMDYYDQGEEYVYSDKGPITAIKTLEDITKDWYNVNSQTYQMGTTVFAGDNAYTGCSQDTLECSTNIYTWDYRTAKARMITFQEAIDLGCAGSINSCPKWLSSTSAYSTMSVYSRLSPRIVKIGNSNISDTAGAEGKYGLRAVIQVSK